MTPIQTEKISNHASHASLSSLMVISCCDIRSCGQGVRDARGTQRRGTRPECVPWLSLTNILINEVLWL